MALAVQLRGVNVGRHRWCRPLAIARQLKHLDATNIGAAGTFVIRRPIIARHTRVAGAGHEIHLYAPALVIEAILDVVQASRRGTRLPAR